MITKIHSASIVAADQDAAVDFSVNKLGWEKRLDNPVGPNYRFITVATYRAEARALEWSTR